MSGAAHNVDQEFWRPPQTNASNPVEPVPAELCPRCNSEFVVGSRFCHVCGAERQAQPQISDPGFTRYLDFHLIRSSLGLTIGALIAFVVGMACLVFAAGTGLIYTASTLLDWQAVQIWRIQWLLAAAAAFLAGILLKRSS